MKAFKAGITKERVAALKKVFAEVGTKAGDAAGREHGKAEGARAGDEEGRKFGYEEGAKAGAAAARKVFNLRKEFRIGHELICRRRPP